MKIDQAGFRKEIKQLFKQFTTVVPKAERQTSPFIVVDGSTVKKCETIKELLKYKDDTEVLQTWPGQKRSDVFYFTVKALKDYLNK